MTDLITRVHRGVHRLTRLGREPSSITIGRGEEGVKFFFDMMKEHGLREELVKGKVTLVGLPVRFRRCRALVRVNAKTGGRARWRAGAMSSMSVTLPGLNLGFMAELRHRRPKVIKVLELGPEWHGSRPLRKRQKVWVRWEKVLDNGLFAIGWLDKNGYWCFAGQKFATGDVVRNLQMGEMSLSQAVMRSRAEMERLMRGSVWDTIELAALGDPSALRIPLSLEMKVYKPKMPIIGPSDV
jgi:hypothetical protein